MVKKQKQSNAIMKHRASEGIPDGSATPRKLTASTLYVICTERVSPYWALLGLVWFLDLLPSEDLFDYVCREPCRTPNLGHQRMLVRILMLLSIGFNWLWHYLYIRINAMVCGFYKLRRPLGTTF